MTAVEKIKTAIAELSPAERQELALEIPGLLPELDGDATWKRVIEDPRPRPALTALLDEVEKEIQSGGRNLIEMTHEELNRKA